jgi:Cof subfamily protein (haloacid dehalogenase superfamily)
MAAHTRRNGAGDFLAGPKRSPARSAPLGDVALVAIDLDGTLLDDSKQVSRRTAMALAGLPERGIKVVIASARPPRSVRHIHSALKLDTFTINYNGAMIHDPVAGTVIDHQPMDPAVVTQIVDRARLAYSGCLVSCEILDRWYTDREDQTYTTETGRLFKPNLVAPLADFCNQPVTKLMVLGPREMINELDPVLRGAFPGLSIMRSDPELIQIMNPLASKATALRKVAEHYGVPMPRVMAIGDAVNDIPMLKAAGVSVAMDNAHPLVKQCAHWVAPSNNDHGVHATLVRYGLCD